MFSMAASFFSLGHEGSRYGIDEFLGLSMSASTEWNEVGSAHCRGYSVLNDLNAVRTGSTQTRLYRSCRSSRAAATSRTKDRAATDLVPDKPWGTRKAIRISPA